MSRTVWSCCSRPRKPTRHFQIILSLKFTNNSCVICVFAATFSASRVFNSSCSYNVPLQKQNRIRHYAKIKYSAKKTVTMPFPASHSFHNRAITCMWFKHAKAICCAVKITHFVEQNLFRSFCLEIFIPTPTTLKPQLCVGAIKGNRLLFRRNKFQENIPHNTTPP